MSLVGKKLGNYQVVSLIGSGGMGSVYIADHPLIGKRVAVKVLHPEMAKNEEFVTRFFHEARAANEIGHPNIVDILDFGRADDDGNEVVYLLMEFLDGESLKHRMKRRPLDPSEIVRVVDQIASALAASHAKHIVHRDLKPDNVYLVVRAGDPLFVKVLDFGIAKLLDMPVGHHVTRSGEVLGTPEYMSPEQCEGKPVIDGRADIYSLGCMLYEMLAGRPPFAGNLREVLIAHIGQSPVDPAAIKPEADPALSAIAMRCLEKDPDRRFQSMQELREALHRLGPSSSLTSLPHVPVTGAGEVHPPLPVPATVDRASPLLAGAPVHTIASSETGVWRPRRKLGLMLGLGGAVVAIAASAGIVFAVARHPKTPAERARPVAQEPVAELLTHIEIRSEPPGATVTRAGREEPMGRTPVTITVMRGEPAFEVRMLLAGYLPAVRKVETWRDGAVLALLMPEPASKPPPASPSVTPSPPTRQPPAARPEPAVKRAPPPNDQPARSTGRKPTGKPRPGRDDILIPNL